MTDTAVIERLKDKRLRAWNDMRGLLENARAEDRAMSAEETQRYAALEGEMKSCSDTIEIEARAGKLADFMNAPAPTVGVPQGEPTSRDDTRNAYEDAFKRYLRRGL